MYFKWVPSIVHRNSICYFQVGQALHFDPIQLQWAALTALYREPCFWKPSDCTAGATLAMWIKTPETGSSTVGIMGSRDTAGRQGWAVEIKTGPQFR